MTQIIVRNIDHEVIAKSELISHIDLRQQPVDLGHGILISDPLISDSTCNLIIDPANIPADLRSGWYTYTAQDGFQLTAVGTASQAAIIARDVPRVVSMAQARLALIAAGHFDAVDAIVTQTGVNSATWTWWHYASEVHRNSDLVNQLGAAIGLAQTDIDTLFYAAALITP